jgi:3-hydroxyacyl-[acyl-carrier-protein] dehydratase
MRWLLIDQILECDPGISAVGVKTFPRSDDIFLDHFPGFPNVPSVLRVEMIAQMASECAAIATPAILPALGNVKDATVYLNINPGDRCAIRAMVTNITKSLVLGEGEIEVDGRKCSWASIPCGLIDRTELTSNTFDRSRSNFKPGGRK